MCSSQTTPSLLFFSSFASPMVINLIVWRTKYYFVLTTEQMNIFMMHTGFLVLQTLGALMMIFKPMSQVDYKFVRAISNWLSRLFLGLTFFALPALTWVYTGLAYKNGILNSCHMNVWFLCYLLINIAHFLFGIYASIMLLLQPPDEAAIEILQQTTQPTPSKKSSSPPQQMFSNEEPSMKSNLNINESSRGDVPRRTRKAWHTIDHEKSVTEMPVIKLSQSSSQIQVDRVINGDH